MSERMTDEIRIRYDDKSYSDPTNMPQADRDVFALIDRIAELEAIKSAAREFVTDSYRPEAKHDAARFDRLRQALQQEKDDE